MSDERDETRQFAPSDDVSGSGEPAQGLTGPAGVDDSTVAAPRSDHTSIMPPADDWATRDATADNWATRDATAAWSGRATVHPPRPGQSPEIDWTPGPVVVPRDRWWMPIVIGTAVLALLAALGVGVYLLAQDASRQPPPAGQTSAAPVPTLTASTAPRTPSTTAPSPSPSTTEPPSSVVIPALIGQSLAQAQATLTTVGIRSRAIYKPSDAAPDTVIDSDPREGQEVPPNTVVTLIVAAPRTSPSTASPTASSHG